MKIFFLISFFLSINVQAQNIVTPSPVSKYLLLAKEAGLVIPKNLVTTIDMVKKKAILELGLLHGERRELISSAIRGNKNAQALILKSLEKKEAKDVALFFLHKVDKAIANSGITFIESHDFLQNAKTLGMDCDLLSMLYIEIGSYILNYLGIDNSYMPLSMIMVSHHAFIRWTFLDGSFLNWETTRIGSAYEIGPTEYKEMYQEKFDIKNILSHIYNMRGNIFCFLQKHELAIADYSQALKINSHHADAHGNRGLSYLISGRDIDALRDFNNAIALDSNDATYYMNRGNLFLEQKQWDSALLNYSEVIQRAFSSNPKLVAFAFNNRGYVYAQQGRYFDAIYDYSRSIELVPQNAYPYNNRSFAYFKLGNIVKAIEDCNQSIKLDPHNKDALKNKNIYEQEQDHLRLANVSSN